jgi:serine/threonine protein kinase
LRNLHEKNQRLSYKQIAHLLDGLASGVDYAHSRGVIHRDIKPANILLHSKSGDFSLERPLTKNTDPILTDFGLVRIAHSGTQTASGLVSGTPKYMSPEQARGDKVDHRTDIYSLGVVLYELLAGHVPFEGENTLVVIYKHIHEPPPPIKNISPQLQEVVNRTLAKNPEERYPSAHDLSLDFHEAIGMPAESETVHSLRPRTPKPAVASRKQKPARSPVWIGAGIFACACLGVLLVGALGISAASRLPWLRTVQPVSQPVASPTSGFIPDTGHEMREPAGVLRFQHGTSAMDQITISAELAPLPKRIQYEAWLIDDDNELRRSLGVLTQNNSGKFSLTFVDPQSQNLLSKFNRMEITLEPNPDDSPNSSRNVLYASSLSPGSLEHIRHLMVGTDETPGQIAVVVGLANNVSLLKQTADAMLEASNAGDRAAAQSKAEEIVNLIVGKEDIVYYGDWNSDGTIGDPGDGYGLLINGSQAGYLDGMIHHAGYAAEASGATAELVMHAGHVEICTQNLETWAPELRDIALRIARAPQDQDIEADIRRAAVLATQMLNGIDIDGNESIDPIAGEGGVNTAVEHAKYMSDMVIVPAENQASSP